MQFPLHVCYLFLLPLLCFSLVSECNQCVSEFAEKRGCDCMQSESCDVTALIPEGCFHCGDKAMAYCGSTEGKDILIFCLILFNVRFLSNH